MTAIPGFVAGAFIGTCAGFYSGYDLAHSSAGLVRGRLGPKVFFGIFRRMAAIALGLFAANALGGAALAGAAVGTIGGFAAAVAAGVRRNGF